MKNLVSSALSMRFRFVLKTQITSTLRRHASTFDAKRRHWFHSRSPSPHPLNRGCAWDYTCSKLSHGTESSWTRLPDRWNSVKASKPERCSFCARGIVRDVDPPFQNIEPLSSDIWGNYYASWTLDVDLWHGAALTTIAIRLRTPRDSRRRALATLLFECLPNTDKDGAILASSRLLICHELFQQAAGNLIRWLESVGVYSVLLFSWRINLFYGIAEYLIKHSSG